MTPNDSQIDLLMRRHAKSARSEQVPGEHLDADALNAFAEGALPQAARSRYVSHLADCDECRKLVTGLSINARGVTAAQTSHASSKAAGSWWQSLSNFIALPALRYAAFAIVLVAIVGIAFLVWRRSNTARTDLVAQNEPAATPVSAVKTDTATASQNAQADQNTQADQSSVAKALPQPTVMSNG
ncbi:MAG TPA: zf-HC2 domain-containing protein, partial [Pyrinomonadaceae bacterium]|nr:zf-HC2 domain-containing protein [Pyrinomonadaceae bacterium]